MNTDPTPPPQRLLSNVRIDKKVNVDAKLLVDKLKHYRASFSAQRKFWVDAAVLNRLEYKNKNQHRQFHRFKRSSEARRLIKRLERLSIGKVITQLYTLFWNEQSITSIKKGTDPTTFPTREFCEYAMQTLIASAVLLDKLQVVLVEVYREYSTCLKLKHFVSLALVHMGLSARLYTLAHKWVKEINDCYDVIQQFHQTFPYGWKKGALYDCQPSTMVDQRRLANQWINNRLSFKHPVHFEYFLTHQATATAAELNLNDDHPMSLQLDAGSTMMDLGENAANIDTGFGIAAAADDGDDDLGEIITRD